MVDKTTTQGDDEHSEPLDSGRREFLKKSVLVAGAAGVGGWSMSAATAWAAGSDKPEKPEINVGFIPLTDCAPIVVASVMGFDKKYGIKINVSKEASWAGVRDKLLNTELDAAHVLYGLVYGVQLGIGGPQKGMAVLMTLNHNGQSITLSNQLREKGATDGRSLKRLIDNDPRDFTFAQTFPTGTHAMWLSYWLAAHGIDPLRDVKTSVVPPPQMVANMRVGNMDGYCVGEPWGARAIADGIGFTAATTQEIWAGHPEKVLGCTQDFVRQYPNSARALTMAVLDAARYIDEGQNRSDVSQLIAGKTYVNAPAEIIEQRFKGVYDNGIGRRWKDENPLRFHDGGRVNFPYYSDAMWFMTQQRRWGLLRTDPDYLAVAKAVNQVDIYKEAATQLKISLPASSMREVTFFDGKVWDARDPRAYVDSFVIKA